MNDNLFIVMLFYMLLGITLVGVLPSSFFNGSSPNQVSIQDLKEDETVELNPANLVSTIGFFGKIMKFMFVPFTIDGIPSILGAILALWHYFIYVSTIIYGIKLFWGGSST